MQDPLNGDGGATDGGVAVPSFLVVCTANICRSPMGEVLLQREADRRSIRAVVGSAGVRALDGSPASEGSVHHMQRRGLDLSTHVSRPADPMLVDGADLVLTMEAAHVVDLVADADPQRSAERFAHTFTLEEFLRRARSVGPRTDDSLADYVQQVGAGRVPRDLIGARDLDVADPIGRSDRHYRRCARQLEQMIAELADLVWGVRAG